MNNGTKEGDMEKNIELFKEKWYARNPAHETNYDTGLDMFWGTAELVAREYVQELERATIHNKDYSKCIHMDVCKIVSENGACKDVNCKHFMRKK